MSPFPWGPGWAGPHISYRTLEQYSFQGAPRSLLALISKKKKKKFFNFLPAVDSRQELGFEARKLGWWKFTGSLKVLFLAQGKSSKTHRRLGPSSGSRPPRPLQKLTRPAGTATRPLSALHRLLAAPGEEAPTCSPGGPAEPESPQKTAWRSQDKHPPLWPRSYVQPRPPPRPHGPRPRTPWAVPPEPRSPLRTPDSSRSPRGADAPPDL